MPQGLRNFTVFKPSSSATTVTLTEKLSSTSDRIFDELPWYRSWVIEQARSQPQRVLLCLPEIDLEGDPDWTGFFLLWDQIRELILKPGPKIISSITDTLVSSGTISIQDNYEGAQPAKDLAFSVLGWQTMLYKPDFSPAVLARDYKIFDETDGYRGEAWSCLSQFAGSAEKRLPEFLLGFGMMLPPRNYCAFGDPDDQVLFSQTLVVTPKDLNAHALTSVCRVEI